MTRLLVFSDIHGAVPAVEALVAQEPGPFDAVIVAGDIGPRPVAFFRALEPLRCPVLYIYGNWDYQFSYHYVFNKRFTHLHGTFAQVGDLRFVGFSGCDSQWGQNPHWLALNAETQHAHRSLLERMNVALAADARKEDEIDAQFAGAKGILAARAAKRGRSISDTRLGALERRRNRAISRECRCADLVRKTRAFHAYARAYDAAWEEVLTRNRLEIVRRTRESDEDPKRCVLVTHARLFRLHEDMSGLGAHFFGHVHGFKVTQHRGATCVNVSALDPWTIHSIGTYGIVEWSGTRGFEVAGKRLPGGQDLRIKCLRYRNTLNVDLEPADLSLPLPYRSFW